MRTIGVAIGVLAIAGFVGLPPVFGRVTQSQVDARLAALADHPLIGASLASYERGWFSSVARIELRPLGDYGAALASLSTDGLPPRALIRVDFAHGPIAVLDGVHLGISRMVARPDPAAPGVAELAARLGVPYLFEFRGRAGFSGALRFDADAPPIDAAIPSGRLIFSGARLTGAARGRAVQYDARLDSFVLDADAGGLRLSQLTAVGDHELRGSLPLGRTEITIERWSISDASRASGPRLDAADVRLSSELALDTGGALLNLRHTLTVGSLSTPPDLTLRDATVELRSGNLDADALAAYWQALQRSVTRGAVDPNLVLADVTPAIERLLAAEPTFAADPVRFTLNGGSFDGRLSAQLRAGALPPAGALDLRDPTLWLDVLEATAEATIAEAPARDLAVQLLSTRLARANPGVPPDQLRSMAEAQVRLVLAILLGQGMIVARDDHYTTHVAFAGGTLTVNGSALPLTPP
jgi:uncharacterized protein YdgA (DUF945 family)